MREAEAQRCIDETGTMVDEQRCREDSPPHGYYAYHPLYRWVCGGNGGYTPGSRVTDYNEVQTPKRWLDLKCRRPASDSI